MKATQGNESTYVSYLETDNFIKMLDEKYIPDTIARVDQIADNLNLDTTLSIEGAAADAKAVGDIVIEIKEEIIPISNEQIDALFDDGFVTSLPNASGVNF